MRVNRRQHSCERKRLKCDGLAFEVNRTARGQFPFFPQKIRVFQSTGCFSGALSWLRVTTPLENFFV